jgi:DNA polymerase III alpha subunit
MKKIGEMPVMDMTIPKSHNFVLENGVVAHNCSYSELGYITMYLKHHYPLEWWAAELNNSGEKKMRHYISVLGSIITPPSLANPADKFVIMSDKIAAPLSTIKGLGPSSICYGQSSSRRFTNG